MLANRKCQENKQNRQTFNSLKLSEVSAIREALSSEKELCAELPKKVPRKQNQANKSTYEKLPKLAIRFDDINHLPNYDNDDVRHGIRCKMEGCGKRTTIYCEKCKVHLCFLPGKRGRNCFKKFHIFNEN